jgi:prophage antirepressor
MYATEELLNNPDLAIRAFMKLKEEMIRRQELEKKIEEQQPKVEFYNDVTGSDTTAEIGTVAKVLNFKSVGRNTLFDILRRQGILQRDNMPFQTYVDRGYFRVVESKWNAPNGDVKVNYKTVVYQKGIEYISKVLRDLGYERIGEILN